MDNSQLANQPKNPIAKDTMQTKQMSIYIDSAACAASYPEQASGIVTSEVAIN